MLVRLLPLALVISMLAPAVTTAVCEWTCVEQLHHQVAETTDGRHHHGDVASDAPAIRAAEDGPCHQVTSSEPAVTSPAQQGLHTPAETPVPPMGIPAPAPSRAWGAVVTVRPPGLLSVATTQLRV